LKPVGLGVLWRNQELSELTADFPPVAFITSYSSVIPPGGEIVIRLLPPKKPTTGMSSRVVVRLGAAIRREFD
jgi:hypothetical protein